MTVVMFPSCYCLCMPGDPGISMRLQRAGQYQQQRAFTGTVGAREADDFTSSQVETDIIQHPTPRREYNSSVRTSQCLAARHHNDCLMLIFLTDLSRVGVGKHSGVISPLQPDQHVPPCGPQTDGAINQVPQMIRVMFGGNKPHPKTLDTTNHEFQQRLGSLGVPGCSSARPGGLRPGRVARTAANATRCCWPPESSTIFRSSSVPRFQLFDDFGQPTGIKVTCITRLRRIGSRG